MERVSKGLQSGGMSRKLQYPHDAHDAEDLDDATDVLELFGTGAGAVQTQRQVERQDREHVDEVQRTLKPVARSPEIGAKFTEKLYAYCSNQRQTNIITILIYLFVIKGRRPLTHHIT